MPAVANGASAPRVVGASHVPLVAAAGDRIAVTAKVAGTGKRVVLGLVLGSPQGSATGGLALGKGGTFSRRGARRVVVRGRVPATVGLGELHTLLVCVNPAGAIGGKGSCRAAAKIATSGTSTEERLAGARQAGRLSKAKAVLFGVLALRGDKRVPAELKGGLGGPDPGPAIPELERVVLERPRAALRQDRVVLGREIADRYAWRKVFAGLFDLYQQVVESHRRPEV